VKYYENLRFVYEIQTRLKELTEQDEVERKSQRRRNRPLTGPGGEPGR